MPLTSSTARARPTWVWVALPVTFAWAWLRIRNRPTKPSLYRDPFTRRRQALAFMDLLMTADEETYGP